MKRRRNRAVDFLAYAAVRLVVGLAQALSIDQAYRFAELLGALAYRIDRRHRRVADENLKHAFGERYSDVERDEIIKGIYRHFACMILEIMHIPRKLNRTTWRKYIRLVGHEKVLDLMLDGGPVILLTGHFGNWEMAGYLFGVFGFPPNSVARSLDNPYIDAYLRRFRQQTGQSLIPKKGGYDQILEVLQSGRVLSMLADQDAGERGLFVDFFGRPASTHKAIALFAIEHRAPIVVGYARRVGPGFRYEVGCDSVFDPAELTGGVDDVRELTQRYTSALERIVARDPEQYLWLHRRWKNQPKARAKPARQAA